MTRTLFVGEPTERDLAVYRARRGGPDRGDRPAQAPRSTREIELPSGRDLDAVARGVIEGDGRWPAYRPRAGPRDRAGHARGPVAEPVRAPDAPLPSPTVFSVEPGIYLEDETGVRIEDLVLLDAGAGRLEFLTRFPRDVLVVG